MNFLSKFIPINTLYMFRVLQMFILRRHFSVRCSTLIVLAASQRGCTINAIDCMYSKLPPDGE